MPQSFLPLFLALGFLSACQSLDQKQSSLVGVDVLWNGGDPLQHGWKMSGPGKFEVERGTLRAEGGMGLLWYSAREYEDFQLDLDWKVENEDDNSGVFLRFPDPGNNPWIAVNQGYEIQICDTAGPKHNTASVYSFQAASSIPTVVPGNWNHYRIEVIGQEYLIMVNGFLVNTFHGKRGLKGYVGLQNHSAGSRVHFRNIQIRELKK